MYILLMKGSHQSAILTQRWVKNRLLLFYIQFIDDILINSPKSFLKAETVFTGLSDFHKLVLSVFKLHFSKAKTKKILYRNFRDFKEDNFNLQNFRDLQKRLSAESVEEYTPFEKVFLDVLNKQAPLKKKVVRSNHAPYITKTTYN